MSRSKAVVLMAAGLGTRMKSSVSKVLHPVAGRPMIFYPIRLAIELGAEKIVVILGHQRARIERYLQTEFPNAPIQIAIQEQQLGTAHAVLCAQDALAGFDGDVFILSGDVPALPTGVIADMDAQGQGAVVSVLGMDLDEPGAYGRLITDAGGSLMAITEARDCTSEQLAVTTVNAGVYRADAKFLFESLQQIGTDNAQNEYYLTDIVADAVKHKLPVSMTVLVGDDAGLAEGVNDRLGLARVEARMQDRLRREAMLNGVTLIDPNTVIFHDGVKIGHDTTIEPNVSLLGSTEIGSGCLVEQGCRINDAKVGDDCHIKANCHIEKTVVEAHCQVGPFARLREGTSLGPHVKVGNFVETKKARFDEGAKASHLSYVGDAHVGAAANIGAGTITCNYDGYRKFKTEIGANAFIGSDTQLVAPVKVGDGAIVAAGSTVTKDVPSDALALSRIAQTNKDGWAEKKRRLEQSRES
ncbi:MAG: bifunctional UDP-N-acetylglucosamine diphosphorylase/glucosamine-1-phosphate N-acetyltransferase GlmU [Myxococcota bacterium]|nr:bifunctional UDP-N-acetylglucosamine diphosphorylase/glucosamine-1-phosphate N-acetyltransferase GlmU [Myxococcota bacterium]